MYLADLWGSLGFLGHTTKMKLWCDRDKIPVIPGLRMNLCRLVLSPGAGHLPVVPPTYSMVLSTEHPPVSIWDQWEAMDSECYETRTGCNCRWSPTLAVSIGVGSVWGGGGGERGRSRCWTGVKVQGAAPWPHRSYITVYKCLQRLNWFAVRPLYGNV